MNNENNEQINIVMNAEELKQIHEKLADIYFDIVDLRKGEISDCYADQNELLDDLRDKCAYLIPFFSHYIA